MARILICDDSDFARRRLREQLEEAGHEVAGIAENGDIAVEKYVSLKPDLVTMDMIMRPGGVLAIKRIKEKDPQAKIIVISIMEENQAEIIEAIRAGAQGYGGKPIKKEVLLGEIDRVLKG